LFSILPFNTALLGGDEPILILSIKHSQVGSWVPAAFIVTMLVPKTMTAVPENDDIVRGIESESVN
jgi:hypothetical protein